MIARGQEGERSIIRWLHGPIEFPEGREEAEVEEMVEEAMPY